MSAFFALAALPNVVPAKFYEKLPGFIPSDTVPLGLDLRGGSYLLLQLDFDTYLRDHMNGVRDGLREELRKAHVGYLDLHAGEKDISLTIRHDTLAPDTDLRAILRRVDPDMSIDQSGDSVRLYYDDRSLRAMQSQLLQQSIEIVNRRVNEAGTKEPIIQSQGIDRIVVQVPGCRTPAPSRRCSARRRR